MTDSCSTGAERAVQRKFSGGAVLGGAALFGAVLLGQFVLEGLGDRQELGPAVAAVSFEPVRLARSDMGPYQLAGAWRVNVDDPRFTGVSALVADGTFLLLLTDGGVAVRLPKPPPNGAAQLDELPAGPGKPGRKRDRDSEALLAEPARRGWWVAFENHDELWLFDQSLEQPLARVRLPRIGVGRNAGIEAMASSPNGLLLFPELGQYALSLGSTKRLQRIPLKGLKGRVSDAARLADGSLLLVERRLTLLGFRNALVRVEQRGGALHVTGRTSLPLGRLDNAEGLSIEPLPNGGTRLWLITDDGHPGSSGTLLLALDAPPVP